MNREEMRDRIAEAVLNFFGRDGAPTDTEQALAIGAAERVMAAVWPEVERLTEERDLAVAHDRQPYPTADAYDKACAALWKHRDRAERAEAKQQAVADLIADFDLLPGGAYIPIGPLRDALDADHPAEAVTDLHAAIRAVLTACLTGEALPLVELAVAYESATGWRAEGRT